MNLTGSRLIVGLRLRSANRGNSNNVFYVSPVGLVNNNNATSTMYPAPARYLKRATRPAVSGMLASAHKESAIHA